MLEKKLERKMKKNSNGYIYSQAALWSYCFTPNLGLPKRSPDHVHLGLERAIAPHGTNQGYRPRNSFKATFWAMISAMQQQRETYNPRSNVSKSPREFQLKLLLSSDPMWCRYESKVWACRLWWPCGPFGLVGFVLLFPFKH